VSIDVLPLEVWAGWVERACRVNEYAAPDRPDAGGARAGTPAGEDSPGTDFNRRGTWEETGLFAAGWTWARRAGEDRGLVCRPEKDHGVSGSVGMVTSAKNGWPLFWCWSTSAPEFVPEQPYTRFAVYAVVNHRGDFAAAARDLAARGYGRPSADPVPVFGEVAAPAGGGDLPPARIFRWMSELHARPENDKWLWHGFVSRGGVTLLNALWKAGKSTLLSHLIRAFDDRADEFLGRAIVPSRVLYVSEEHEDLWAERRDDLLIGDHVGMVTREHLPFRGRSNPAEWAALIGNVARAVAEHRFDVVVFDTISKLWPARDENDAGEVENALMPLWNITNTGAGLILVHHNRKSGGKDFTGARGSGGLPAFAETIVEFARSSDESKDCKRVLTSGGRYRETPDKWLIELTPAGYVAHGDPDDLTPDRKVEIGVAAATNVEDWTARAVRLLSDDPMLAMTQAELVARLEAGDRGKGVRKADLVAWLRDRVSDRTLERIGQGTKSSPYRWYRAGECCSAPQGDGAGTESTGVRESR
jgi:hypothetical protein